MNRKLYRFHFIRAVNGCYYWQDILATSKREAVQKWNAIKGTFGPIIFISIVQTDSPTICWGDIVIPTNAI